MRRLIVALVACAMIFITLGSSAEAAPIRHCSSPSKAIVNLTTRMFTCKEARSIARDYQTNDPYRLNMNEHVTYRNGYADVRLTRYQYVVRFQMVQD